MHATLRRIDLNLLLVFDALYRHRSVAAAADELAMSPSACSHALSRLRHALSDELFMRYGQAMQPTVQADCIAATVGDALQALSERLDSTGPFLSATSTRSFTFVASDFTAFAVLPALVALVESEAPQIRIDVVHTAHRDAMDDLAAGRAHFVLGFSDESSGTVDGVATIQGAVEDYVVVRRRGHGRIGGTLSLAHYLAERHVAVVPWADSRGVIDTALARQGLERDVAVRLPGMLAVPFIIAGSDFLATIPRRMSGQLGPAAEVAIHPVPFTVPGFALTVFFHARHAGVPGHAWMRERIARALASMK